MKLHTRNISRSRSRSEGGVEDDAASVSGGKETGTNAGGASTAASTTTPPVPTIGRPASRSLGARGDNLAVALSGGTTKSKSGALKKKNSTIFGISYKTSYVRVDNGDLIFALTEDDLEFDEQEGNNVKKYPLLEIRELRMVSPNSPEFVVKIGHPESKSLKTVTLKAETSDEALEWIETLKHEIKNQVLVCKNMAQVLSDKGKPEKAEPLYTQSIDALMVAYGPDHVEVAEAMKSYSNWLKSQNRLSEARSMRVKAKRIARAFYAGTGSIDAGEWDDGNESDENTKTQQGDGDEDSEGGEGVAELSSTMGKPRSESSGQAPKSRTKSWMPSFSRVAIGTGP